MSTSTEREQTLIASVQRALSLVDIVANSARPVQTKSLAQSAALTMGTTYNLVRTLIHEGYLVSQPDGLVLGPRFPGFAPGQESRGVFLAHVRTALNTVTDQTGVTAYLSRFSDGEVHLIDIVDARRSPRVELWVGLHESAHATALGKQILAELPLEERLDYVSRHPLGELTPHTISDRRALLTVLERPREWMTDREEYAIGHTCIAVPVTAPGMNASLAVSVPTENRDVNTEDIARRLRSAASRLSLQLGAEKFGQA
ncbi:IclR family transcriptional regulator [Microbacterium sp. A93]|uniref:IclR family transcriptional regulator n=1 Tax=unclassified Microbacterium TaxID=2609290 RepID=UPI003F41C9B9